MGTLAAEAATTETAASAEAAALRTLASEAATATEAAEVGGGLLADVNQQLEEGTTAL